MMMYAFFMGYTSMMIPMGMVAQKFGGKRPIMGALLINGLVSILTPWMTLLVSTTQCHYSRVPAS